MPFHICEHELQALGLLVALWGSAKLLARLCWLRFRRALGR